MRTELANCTFSISSGNVSLFARHFGTKQLIKISLVRLWIIYYKNNAVVRLLCLVSGSVLFSRCFVFFCLFCFIPSFLFYVIHGKKSDKVVVVVVVGC